MEKSDPGQKEGSKQAFVSKEDRPDVKISLDTPLSELHVRELGAILGYMMAKTTFEGDKTSLKDFFDKEFPEVAKDWIKDIKPEKLEKLENEKNEKIEKYEKLEKNEKREKNEKIEKYEKHEKPEFKEHIKIEKLEQDHLVFEPQFPPQPDPGLTQIIQVVAGLTKQVSQLTNQVEELKKRIEAKG